MAAPGSDDIGAQMKADLVQACKEALLESRRIDLPVEVWAETIGEVLVDLIETAVMAPYEAAIRKVGDAGLAEVRRLRSLLDTYRERLEVNVAARENALEGEAPGGFRYAMSGQVDGLRVALQVLSELYPIRHEGAQS